MDGIPYILRWAALSPSKLPIPMAESGHHLIHASLGPPKSTSQMASQSVQPFLQGSVLWQTDRQTDCTTRFVTIACISIVLPCGLITRKPSLEVTLTLMLLVGRQEGHLACKNWVVRYWKTKELDKTTNKLCKCCVHICFCPLVIQNVPATSLRASVDDNGIFPSCDLEIWPMVVSYLEFNVPFQHKYGYIIDKLMMVTFKPNL